MGTDPLALDELEDEGIGLGTHLLGLAFHNIRRSRNRKLNKFDREGNDEKHFIVWRRIHGAYNCRNC